MLLSRRALLVMSAALPLSSCVYANQVAPPVPGSRNDGASVRGDAGQTGQMPGPGPASSPHLLWSAAGLEGYGSGPIAVNDLVLAMSEASGKSLVALDAATGDERWRIDRGRRLTLPAAPAYASGLVFVSAREPDGDRRPLVLAIDIGTGQVVWQVPLDGTTRVDEWLIPLASGERVYIAATTGICASFDASTGQERWRVDIARVKAVQPTSVGDIVVFNTEDGLIALDATTGHERWRGGPIGSMSTAATSDLLYVVGSGARQYELPVLHAVDVLTGAERWTVSSVMGAPAVAGERVYIGGQEGFLALDAHSGSTLWQVDSLQAHTPVVVDDVIFAPADADFYALNATTGTTVWSVEGWGDAIESAHALGGPAVLKGKMFFYADGGFLVALGD